MDPFLKKLEHSIEHCGLSSLDKMDNFSRFSRRQVIANFLNRYEIYKRILNIHGSIIEGGVNLGQGLFSWLHFSSIFEPYNHSRRIIGFDTFEGFPPGHVKDGPRFKNPDDWKEFNQKQNFDTMMESVAAQNGNRVLEQIEKLELVKGNAVLTIPKFVEKNSHLLVALLHLDFDIYEPTLVALEQFVPRMPKGAVIAFDEVNDPKGPGETLALLESSIGNRAGRLERHNFDSNLCFMVLE